jgi:hypothetical protein
MGCSNSHEASGPCAVESDQPGAGEPIFDHALASCNEAMAKGCFDGEIDGGSPCSLCIALLTYQSREIAAAFTQTYRDAGVTAEDVARMMDQCIAKAADCAAMNKCAEGAFLYGCPTPPCGP